MGHAFLFFLCLFGFWSFTMGGGGSTFLIWMAIGLQYVNNAVVWPDVSMSIKLIFFFGQKSDFSLYFLLKKVVKTKVKLLFDVKSWSEFQVNEEIQKWIYYFEWVVDSERYTENIFFVNLEQYFLYQLTML